jgi:hypothetical protein
MHIPAANSCRQHGATNGGQCLFETLIEGVGAKDSTLKALGAEQIMADCFGPPTMSPDKEKAALAYHGPLPAGDGEQG